MAIMMGKLYSALRAGGVTEREAVEAAEEVAGFENRGAKIEADLVLIKWMLGGIYALSVPVAWLLLRVAAKVGALS